MIIGQIDIERIAIGKTENDPPIARYRNAPHALEIAFQRVKTIARQIEVRGVLGPVQVAKNVRDPARPIGTDFARLALVEAFQTPVAERPYHRQVCTVYRHRHQ